MNIETMQVHEAGEWSVVSFRSADRPTRTVVSIEHEVWEEHGSVIDQWCVGFSDDPAEVQALFDTAVRHLAEPHRRATGHPAWDLDPQLLAAA